MAISEFKEVVGVRARFTNGNKREMTGLGAIEAKRQFAAFLRREDCEHVEYITKSYDRAAAVAKIYRDMHRDYKGVMPDGTKTIMILRNGGSCLVGLGGLTDDEIVRLLN